MQSVSAFGWLACSQVEQQSCALQHCRNWIKKNDKDQTQPIWFLSYVFQSWLFHNEKLAKVKITFEQKCSLAPLLAGWLCPNWSDKVVRYNVAPTGLKKMTS